MSDRLSLLNLYLEWGADEALISTCTNHLEIIEPTRVSPPTTITRPPTMRHPIQQTHHNDLLKAENLEQICKLINAFKDFPLHDTAIHSVLPKGNPNSSLFIIGEVPDADEDRSGQVFAGITSFWLHQLFHSIQQSLDECFCMPIIPWRPPGGRQVSKNELNLCLPFLYRIFEIYKPKFILTMGLLPAQILLQTQSPFTDIKGQWHPFFLKEQATNSMLFPLRHPVQMNASSKIRKETWQDLLKIKSTLQQ